MASRGRILFILLLFCLGCSSGGSFLSKIRAHSESENYAAQAMLDEDPSLVSYRDGQGRTPLHVAADSCNVPITMLLIKRGADVNAEDKDGKTPLHYALKPSILEQGDPSKGDVAINFLVAKRLYDDQRTILLALVKNGADKSIIEEHYKSWMTEEPPAP